MSFNFDADSLTSIVSRETPMTKDQGLRFLREHQPLPNTQEIDEELLRQFNEVREFFRINPDPRAVPLLLNALSEGDGHGVYQLVEQTILAHPEDVVVPAIIDALHSRSAAVRAWAAEIAANYAAPALIEPLVQLFRHGTSDERIAAATALDAIGAPNLRDEFENALESDIGEEVKKFIRELL